MSSFGPLTGTGTHALSAGVGALHVHINTLPPIAGEGNANPANWYHAGLIRAGDGTAWWRPIPIEATDAWIEVPDGATIIGYWINVGGSITVTEVIGSNPFAGPVGPSGATGATGPGVPTGGSTGQVLAKNSATSFDTAWVTSSTTFVGVRARRATDQTLAASTGTAISFSTTRFDSDTFWSGGAATRLTVPTGKAGYYAISGGLQYASNATGDRQAQLRLNGATVLADQMQNAIGGNVTILEVSTIYHLADADFVELIGYQSSGVNLNVNAAGNYSPELALARLG